MSRWTADGTLELAFSRYDEGIPEPRVGYSPDWEKLHASIPRVKGDQRACPAIISREHLGITLFMPYTFRLYRDGRFQVDTWWRKEGPPTFTFVPEPKLIGLGPGGSHGSILGSSIELPTAPGNPDSLVIFTLGDLRLGTWIFDSGIRIEGLPSDYTLFIAPLPNQAYPPTWSVGQALARPHLMQGMGPRIPVDFQLSRLPPDEDAIVIERGTPMCQYIPMKAPLVTLRPRANAGEARRTER